MDLIDKKNVYTGLFLTWPTSYEALIGRAELKAGLFS